MYLQQCFPHIFFLLTQDNLPRFVCAPITKCQKISQKLDTPPKRNETSRAKRPRHAPVATL